MKNLRQMIERDGARLIAAVALTLAFAAAAWIVSYAALTGARALGWI